MLHLSQVLLADWNPIHVGYVLHFSSPIVFARLIPYRKHAWKTWVRVAIRLYSRPRSHAFLHPNAPAPRKLVNFHIAQNKYRFSTNHYQNLSKASSTHANKIKHTSPPPLHQHQPSISTLSEHGDPSQEAALGLEVDHGEAAGREQDHGRPRARILIGLLLLEMDLLGGIGDLGDRLGRGLIVLGLLGGGRRGVLMGVGVGGLRWIAIFPVICFIENGTDESITGTVVNQRSLDILDERLYSNDHGDLDFHHD